LIRVRRLLALQLVDREGALRELGIDQQHPDEAGREQRRDEQHERGTGRRVSRPHDSQRRWLTRGGRSRRRCTDRRSRRRSNQNAIDAGLRCRHFRHRHFNEGKRAHAACLIRSIARSRTDAARGLAATSAALA
jgi:hypothetical protein